MWQTTDRETDHATKKMCSYRRNPFSTAISPNNTDVHVRMLRMGISKAFDKTTGLLQSGRQLVADVSCTVQTSLQRQRKNIRQVGNLLQSFHGDVVHIWGRYYMSNKCKSHWALCTVSENMLLFGERVCNWEFKLQPSNHFFSWRMERLLHTVSLELQDRLWQMKFLFV